MFNESSTFNRPKQSASLLLMQCKAIATCTEVSEIDGHKASMNETLTSGVQNIYLPFINTYRDVLLNHRKMYCLSLSLALSVAGTRSAIGRAPDPVWQHTFVSPSAFSRRAVVSYWRKYVHEVLVNRLRGLSLPRKSVVRLTDRPDMTLDVYRGRKTTNQQQQQQQLSLSGRSVNLIILFLGRIRPPKRFTRTSYPFFRQ